MGKRTQRHTRLKVDLASSLVADVIQAYIVMKNLNYKATEVRCGGIDIQSADMGKSLSQV